MTLGKNMKSGSLYKKKTTTRGVGKKWQSGKWIKRHPRLTSLTENMSRLRGTNAATERSLEIYRLEGEQEHLTVITCGPGRADRM